jgi:hypothetical protein
VANLGEMKIDIAEAIGKATAAICIETGLIRLLLDKGMITKDEVSNLAAEAQLALNGMVGLSEEALELAMAALRGCTQSWTKGMTRN